MKPKPGTYALILRSRSKTEVQVGRLGRLCVEPGYYIYVGSAFGPGGVRARVSRHCRETKSKHWHIDYLRELVTPVDAWVSHASRRLEHQWAKVFSDMAGVYAVKGFGCSDCDCHSHLFASSAKPDFARFSNIVGAGVKSWSYRLAG